MIRTIQEAYRAMSGKEPDAPTASRLARSLAAIGVTRERDPIVGMLVLLDMYYDAVCSKAITIRKERYAVQTMLDAMRTELAHGQAAAVQAQATMDDRLYEILDVLSAIENRIIGIQTDLAGVNSWRDRIQIQLDGMKTRLCKLEARPTGLRSLFCGGPAKSTSSQR